MMKTLISLSSFYLLFLLIVFCTGSADVHTDQNFIKDAVGRTLLYHGVNFVSKGYPWYPTRLLDNNFVANMSRWGLNFVRLGIMWSGVEPQPGKYNYTYINIMKNIVEILQTNKIYVLLDMHQDVLSSRTGPYDGIPTWLYDRFPPPAHSYPWPLKKIDNWFFGYVTEACSHGFQCLYDNVSGAVEALSNFWRLIATTFSPYSNLLGYELINEPWAGNYFENPFLLLPGVAGFQNLQPFYDKLSTAIRSVDNDTLIFYEPVVWGVRFNGNYSGTGFTHVPGGDDYRNRSVLSYHYYCSIIQIIPVPGNETIPIFDRVLCDDVEGPALFRSALLDANRLGGSLFLTEFGGCDDSPTCIEQIAWGLEYADQYFQSWAYWSDDFYHDMTENQRFSRIYARAIAGTPSKMQFDPDTRTFQFVYMIDTTIKKPTEIFVSPLVYPQGKYNVTVNENIQWKVDPTDSSIILLEPIQQYRNVQQKNIPGVVSIYPTGSQ